MSLNLATILREAARERPDAPCVVLVEGRTLSYGELDARSAQLAAGLRDSGLDTGDRVVLQLPNGTAFVESYFALLRAGLIAVPVNPLLTPRELGHVLDDCGAAALVVAPGGRAGALEALAARRGTRLLVAEEGEGGGDLAALRGARSLDLAATSGDDTAVIVYTSGTTGRPKGAELTHTQLHLNCAVTSEAGGMHADDVALTALPLFHVFGLSTVLNSVVRRGARLVLLGRFEPEAAVGALRTYRATMFYGVPTMFTMMLEALRTGPPLDDLRRAFSGGAAIPVEVVRRFEFAAPGATILEGYGLSETASAVTFNVSAAQRRLGSVGRPIWGVDVRTVDEHGAPAGEEVGEVIVRGHNVMKGYWANPGATAEALRDGWLHTGDLGRFDADGYLHIVDRKKDLVIRGGYNVYPREVEEVLHEHPDVAEAAVVGRPDERLGEEVVAFVSLRPGVACSDEALVDFCRERLAAYKLPRAVTVVDELPKGPTGKVLKVELRRTAARASEQRGAHVAR